MFFLWIQYENRGKGYYLPQVDNWSSRIEITQASGHEAGKIELPVSVNDGVYSVDLPEGFYWTDGAVGSKTLEHCKKISLRSMSIQINIYIAEVDGKSTVLKKYALSMQPLTIGSKEENMIQYAELPVSRNHAEIRIGPNGGHQFTDRSKNGSFVNGKFCLNVTVPLKFGDTIMILPALCMVYLGDCLAVSNVARLTVSGVLKPYQTDIRKNRVHSAEDISVVREYHRAPRHVQQAKVEQLEIDPPLEKERRRDLPTWLAIGPSFTMVLPMLMSSLVTGRNMASSMVMIGTSSVLAVMWGSINRKYQKKQSVRNEQTRQQVCKQYYAEIEERLIADTEREKKRLFYNYLSVEECTNLPAAGECRLWERMPQHNDFLMVRLGLGERILPTQINVKQVKIALTDDPLRHEPQRLYDQYQMIHDVPVLFDLMRNQIVGVLSRETDPWLMQSMVVQAAANHSYHDVRIAVLHTREDAKQWHFAKWLPHVFTADDRSLRMVVSDENAVQEVLGHIDSVLSMRADLAREEEDEQSVSGKLPWYLIFCTNPRILEDQPIVRYLTSNGLGFTLIMQTATIEMLPKECNAIIEAKERLGAVYTMDGSMDGVRFEATTGDKLEHFSRNMAPVRIKEVVEDSAIPSLVTFLETYRVRRVEDLDIRYYWNENHAYNSVKAKLGLKAGAVPFVLDISDKNHGPHGLIAGTTGAGKSVLLQTFILSLAINYSPTEVQFILIDYKGGGTSEDFRGLPHAAGVIDSLQGERMIFRALASIKGEIIRREELFKSVGVNNVDDYMKYYNSDPTMESLGHLIIIVDEFAELKKEQPEFMHELVSAARVGRSLGIHLVLATQKPSNSVSDEIAANTRFRICLRVASKSDSSEMLKRPEAAYLKGMGRCYVQVGSDEVFEQVQTSYSGADYLPDALRPEEEPRMLNDAGQPIRLKRKKNSVLHGGQRAKTELDAVLEQLDYVCDQYHFARARKMWLEELGDKLCLHEIAEVESCRFDGISWPQNSHDELLAYIALADDIQMQRYLPVALDFVKDKNQMIIGLAGSGKTTMLQTIAASLALRYSPQELNMYVFSLTSRMLSCLDTLPHVGEIVYEEEIDEQIRLMEMIYAECERRKKLFAKMSTDNYIQYNRAVRAAGHEELIVPAVVVLIDRMQQLRDWANNRRDDKLQLFYDMLRSANSQGVYFVMTAFDRGELPIKYHAYVHGTALQLSERINYSDALAARIPVEWGGIRSHAGRGLIACEDKEAKETYIYEIQSAVYGTAESDSGRAELIRQLGAQMRSAWQGKVPKGIARIPSDPNLLDFLSHEEMHAAIEKADQLPLYYEKNTGEAKCINLREVFSMLVCGPRKSGKTGVLRNMASTFAQKNAVIQMVGSDELASWAREHGVNGYAYGDPAWKNVFMSQMMKEIKKRSDLLQAAREQGGEKARSMLLETFTPIVILIDDLDLYMEKYDGDPNMSAYLKYYCEDKVSGYGIYLYATISHTGYLRTKLKEAVVGFIGGKRGLMLQGRLSECDPFNVQIPYAQKSQAYPLGEGLLIADGETTHVVIPKWNER
ncbi:MAG: type VII secretion protein EssC [Clostridia bacterium]|nr:type VII secretion protein EssC [Clostridia bacterium]